MDAQDRVHHPSRRSRLALINRVVLSRYHNGRQQLGTTHSKTMRFGSERCDSFPGKVNYRSVLSRYNNGGQRLSMTDGKTM